MENVHSSPFSFLFPWLAPLVIKFEVVDGGVEVQLYKHKQLCQNWHPSQLHRVLSLELTKWIEDHHIHECPQPYPLIKQLWHYLMPHASKKFIIDATALAELAEIDQAQNIELVWELNNTSERIKGHFESADRYLGMGWFQQGNKVWSLKSQPSASVDAQLRNPVLPLPQAGHLLKTIIPDMRRYLLTRANFQLITDFAAQVIAADARSGGLILKLQCNYPQFLPTLQVPQQSKDVLLADKAIIECPQQVRTPVLMQLLQSRSSIVVQGANVPQFISEQLPIMRQQHQISEDMAAKITQSNPIVSIATLKPTISFMHTFENGLGGYTIAAKYTYNQHDLDMSVLLAAHQRGQRFIQQYGIWFEWLANSRELVNTILQQRGAHILRLEEVMGFDTRRTVLLDKQLSTTIQPAGAAPAERGHSVFTQLQYHGIPGGIIGEAGVTKVFVDVCEQLWHGNRQARILWLVPSNKKGSVTRAINNSTVASYVTVASLVTLRDEPALFSHHWTLVLFQDLDHLLDGSYQSETLAGLRWQWALTSVSSTRALRPSAMRVLHLPEQYFEQFRTRYLFDLEKSYEPPVVRQSVNGVNGAQARPAITPKKEELVRPAMVPPAPFSRSTTPPVAPQKETPVRPIIVPPTPAARPPIPPVAPKKAEPVRPTMQTPRDASQPGSDARQKQETSMERRINDLKAAIQLRAEAQKTEIQHRIEEQKARGSSTQAAQSVSKTPEIHVTSAKPSPLDTAKPSTLTHPTVSIAALKPIPAYKYTYEHGIGTYTIIATYEYQGHMVDMDALLAAYQRKQRSVRQHDIWFEWPANADSLVSTIQQQREPQVLLPEEIMGFDTQLINLLTKKPPIPIIQPVGVIPAERSRSIFEQLREHGIPGGIVGKPEGQAALFVNACEDLLRENEQARVLWLVPWHSKDSVIQTLDKSGLHRYVTVASTEVLHEKSALLTRFWTLVIFQELDKLLVDSSHSTKLPHLQWQWALTSVISRSALSPTAMQALHIPEQYQEQFCTRYLFEVSQQPPVQSAYFASARSASERISPRPVYRAIELNQEEIARLHEESELLRERLTVEDEDQEQTRDAIELNQQKIRQLHEESELLRERLTVEDEDQTQPPFITEPASASAAPAVSPGQQLLQTPASVSEKDRAEKVVAQTPDKDQTEKIPVQVSLSVEEAKNNEQQPNSASPIEQRVAVMKEYWQRFDEIHAHQKTGMEPLRAGQAGNPLTIGFEHRFLFYKPIYQQLLPDDLLVEIDRLWGTTMLPRSPERIISEPFPHELFTQTFGVALNFWHSCALNVWSFSEGSLFFDLDRLVEHYQEEIQAFKDMGTPINRQIFEDLVKAQFQVGQMSSYSTNDNPRREGFEKLRDIISLHRRQWANMYLDKYIKKRYEAEIHEAKLSYSFATSDKGTPPTAKQFAKDAKDAANHWFGGDISEVYGAIKESAPFKPERIALLPSDKAAFVLAVFEILQQKSVPVDKLTRDQHSQLNKLAPLVFGYIRLEEALGYPPTLDTFGSNKFLPLGHASSIDEAWDNFADAIKRALLALGIISKSSKTVPTESKADSEVVRKLAETLPESTDFVEGLIKANLKSVLDKVEADLGARQKSAKFVPEITTPMSESAPKSASSIPEQKKPIPAQSQKSAKIVLERAKPSPEPTPQPAMELDEEVIAKLHEGADYLQERLTVETAEHPRVSPGSLPAAFSLHDPAPALDPVPEPVLVDFESSATQENLPDVDEDWRGILQKWKTEHWEIIVAVYQGHADQLNVVANRVQRPVSRLITEINDPVAEQLDDMLIDPETLTIPEYFHEVAEKLAHWYLLSNGKELFS